MIGRVLRRPVTRFTVVGVAMTAVHLVLLRLISGLVPPEAANIFAFAIDTQVNFVISHRWTWAERRGVERSRVDLARQVLLFNASCLGAFTVNEAVLSAGLRLGGLPLLPAALLATAVSAAASFLLSSRLVFRRGTAPAAAPPALPVLPVGASLGR